MLPRAVFVEFPQEGSLVLGFVSRELTDLEQFEILVFVFVPTAFVPPQGFLLFLSKEKIIPSHLTIEEAIKLLCLWGSSLHQKKILFPEWNQERLKIESSLLKFKKSERRIP